MSSPSTLNVLLVERDTDGVSLSTMKVPLPDGEEGVVAVLVNESTGGCRDRSSGVGYVVARFPSDTLVRFGVLFASKDEIKDIGIFNGG